MNFILEFDEWIDAEESGQLYEFRTKGAKNLTDAERAERDRLGKQAYGHVASSGYEGGIAGGRKWGKRGMIAGGITGGLAGGIGGAMFGKYIAGANKWGKKDTRKSMALAGGAAGVAGGLLGGGIGGVAGYIPGRSLGAYNARVKAGHSISPRVGQAANWFGAMGARRAARKEYTQKLKSAHPNITTESLEYGDDLYMEDIFLDYLTLEAQDIFDNIQNENYYNEEELEEIAEILEAEKTEAQKKYQAFFKNKCQEHGISHPGELDKAGKKKFFGEIKDEWKKVSSIPECLYMSDEEFIILAENLTDDDLEYLLVIDEDERIAIIENFLVEFYEAETVLPFGLINYVTEEIESIIENDGNINDIKDYLYENYGIELDEDNFLYDLNEEGATATAEKPTAGQKIKGHFKKHWKKYAAGAGGAAVVGGGYLAGKKGYLGQKGKDATAAVDKTVGKVGSGIAGAAKGAGGAVVGAAKGIANKFKKKED